MGGQPLTLSHAWSVVCILGSAQTKCSAGNETKCSAGERVHVFQPDGFLHCYLTAVLGVVRLRVDWWVSKDAECGLWGQVSGI